MGDTTNIGWATHTASPHMICGEVDPCCANCYAREMITTKSEDRIREIYRLAGIKDWDTKRLWGDDAPRIIGVTFWNNAKKWNKAAEGKGGLNRPRMFTSLIDWLDDMPAGILDTSGTWLTRQYALAKFLHTVWKCQNLDWLLLTKRPENFFSFVRELMDGLSKGALLDKETSRMESLGLYTWLHAWIHGSPPNNVWFGYTAGTKDQWKSRYDIVKSIPAKVRWCSAEPLLTDLHVEDIAPKGECFDLDWVVVGGESGPKRRPMNIEWLTNLTKECKARGSRVYVKQDENLRQGQQGRIPNDIWAIKEYPIV